MVLGVCRAVLSNPGDEEDAFQATFLALSRTAAGPRRPSRVGAWLHAVARRIAAKLRASAVRRQVIERQAGERERVTDACHSDLREVLDEEVGRLPARWREAILRCYFHGQTRQQAARQLGWSLRTLERRLEQWRQILRERLTARGTTLGILLALAPALVPAALAETTARTVMGEAPVRVAELAQVTLSGYSILRGKILFACLFLLGLTGSVLGLLPRADPPVKTSLAAPAQRSTDPSPSEERLPKGALGRLGSTRFRHGFGIGTIAYSRDGKLLASAGNGRSLCLWDARTGRLLHHCKGERYPNSLTLAVSPDGRTVAEANGNFIKLWSVATGKEVREYAGHSAVIMALAYSSDGKVLASGGTDKTIRLWDAGTGREIRVLKEHANELFAVAFRDDGKVLASADRDGTVQLWDPRTGTLLHVCTGHRNPVMALAFEPVGKRVVSCDFSGEVRTWHSDGGKLERIVSDDGTGAFSLAFSPDGKTVAVGRTKAVVLHDLASGKEIRRWQAHAERVNSLAWSPDGKTLASCGHLHSAIRKWDPRTGEEQTDGQAGHIGPLDRLKFRADGSRLFSVGRDGSSLEWNIATRKKELIASDLPVSLLDFILDVSQDRSIFAVASLPTANRPAEPFIDLYERHAKKRLYRLAGHTDAIMSAAFDPRGRWLFSLSKDRTVRAWDVSTRAQLWQANVGTAVGRGPHVRSLAVSPDGKRVATVVDTILYIHDSATGKELRKDTYGQHVFSLTWSPDGEWIALVGGSSIFMRDVYLGLWDTRAGERRRYWKSPQAGFGNQAGRAFSPDSRFLATGSDHLDSNVYLWEVATGGKVAVFEGHHSGAWHVAFSPDGQTLASGGGDSSILL
jgi:RNA polymerase sigma factor (sigma-70 family)